MGREKDGGARGRSGREAFRQAALGERIEADHRLVEDENVRVVQEGLREGHALPGTVGEGLVALARKLRQVERGELHIDPVFQFRPAPGEHGSHEAQGLARRPLRPEIRTVGHETEPRFRGDGIARDVDSREEGPAGRRGEEAGEEADRRRLARAVRADEGEKGSGGNLEGEVRKGRLVAVALCRSLEQDRRGRGEIRCDGQA